MTGWEQNDDPASFLQADVDEAAGRLAAILRGGGAPTCSPTYDWHGNYGHPDHIKVHDVGHRAAELAGTPRVFEATMNRDAIVRMMRRHAAPTSRRPATRTSIRADRPTTATRSACRRPSSRTAVDVARLRRAEAGVDRRATAAR